MYKDGHMKKITGLYDSGVDGSLTGLIYEDGSVNPNGYRVDGNRIISISNAGDKSMVISEAFAGQRILNVINLQSGSMTQQVL
jgi:hypothetical protein